MLQNRIDFLQNQTFPDHNNCRLGKWHISEGKELMGGTKSYKDIAPHHKIVHDLVLENIKYITGKDQVKINVEEIIKNFTEMEVESSNLFLTMESMLDEYKY